MTTTTCHGPECVRDATVRGLCHAHYNQTHRGNQLRPLRPFTPGSTCAAHGCTADAISLGLCRLHYRRSRKRPCVGPDCQRTARTARDLCDSHARQWSTTGTLTPLRAGVAEVCTVDGCDAPGKAKGLCKRHYDRAWRERRPKPTRPAKPRKAKAAKVKAATIATSPSTLPEGWNTPTIRKRRPSPTPTTDTVQIIVHEPDDATKARARANVIRLGGSDLLDMLGLGAA